MSRLSGKGSLVFRAVFEFRPVSRNPVKCDSRRLHHSTRERSERVEWCPERATKGSESKGPSEPLDPAQGESKDPHRSWPASRKPPGWCFPADDGIVVLVAFVYILRCADGTLYTGCARDPRAREEAHNKGRGARYTSGRRPVSLVYAEECNSPGEALRREHQVKRWTRAKKEALIAGDLNLLKRP